MNVWLGLVAVGVLTFGVWAVWDLVSYHKGWGKYTRRRR